MDERSMSIPISTVCYLTGDHSRAGQMCTVAGPLTLQDLWHVAQRRNVTVWAYNIELCRPDGHLWSAAVNELIPIAPPGLTKDEDKREPAHV